MVYIGDVGRGDLLHGHQLVCRITLAQACALERTLQRRCKVTIQHEKWQLPAGDMSQYIVGVELRHQGSLLTVGEVTVPHWIATARYKLGSPRSVRCYPATVRLPYWVRGA